MENISNGVLWYEVGVSSGYTLFMPLQSTRAFLIDYKGDVVHYWQGPVPNSGTVTLLENGHLLYSGLADSQDPYGYPSAGEIVELDWDGQVVWTYDFASDEYRQHHDLEVLPNGDILFMAWELIPADELLAAGRDPDITPAEGILSDKICLLHKTEDGEEIVWEWRVFDHLVQDEDPSKENYGVVSEHPELIDLNFKGNVYATGRSDMDWTHLNSLDYNEETNQIVLSSRNFGEIWVIDLDLDAPDGESQSDILYRWGNPQAYGMGDADDQILFGQHDVQWITSDLPGTGDILLFNNGTKREGLEYSSVVEIDIPDMVNGEYPLLSTGIYGPQSVSWEWTSLEGGFYSGYVSGAQRLENGNTLICSGLQGRLFEVDQEGRVVWDFVNPILSETGIQKGETQNWIFDCERYPLDYPAFEDKTLTSIPLSSFPTALGKTTIYGQGNWAFSNAFATV